MKVRPRECALEVVAAIEMEKDVKLEEIEKTECLKCGAYDAEDEDGVCRNCGYDLREDITGVLIW